MESIDKILQERGPRYGNFTDHAIMSQSIKQIIQHGNGTKNMRAFQREAISMIIHKIARIANGDPDYRDSWDDIAGYAKLVADRLPRQRTDPN